MPDSQSSRTTVFLLRSIPSHNSYSPNSHTGTPCCHSRLCHRFRCYPRHSPQKRPNLKKTATHYTFLNIHFLLWNSKQNTHHHNILSVILNVCIWQIFMARYWLSANTHAEPCYVGFTSIRTVKLNAVFFALLPPQFRLNLRHFYVLTIYTKPF